MWPTSSFGIILLFAVSLYDAKTVLKHLFDEDFNEIEYMNLSADPCDNFYEYTCGNFKNIYPLQEGDVLIDQFTLLEDKLADVVHEILESRLEKYDPLALKKAKTAYHACVDYEFMDTYGMIHPEVEVAEKYGGFPILGKLYKNISLSDQDDSLSDQEKIPFGWYQIADLAAEFGISIFLTPSLYYDTQNASRNILRISVDGMEIPVQFRPRPSQSYEDAIEEGFLAMVNQTEQNTKNRLTAEKSISAMEVLLRKLVLKMKRIMGSDRSDEYLYEKVANISNFLKGIYYGGYIPNNTQVGPITNDSSATEVTLKQLNEWTVKHFGNDLKLDWVKYVKSLLSYTYVDVDENFLVLHPIGLNKTLYGILNWVKMNDEEIVKSAALLRVFVYTASDSDTETRRDFDEYLKATGKIKYPRWKYCSRKIMDAYGTLSLSLAVAYQYQLSYFNKSKLQAASSLVNNLRSTFKQVIEDTTWMDDDSKAAAQTKADNIITLLGYPDFITQLYRLDHFYDNLQITSWDHYENAKKLRAFQQAYTLNMISLRVRTAWEKSPFDVNAYNNRQNNRIILPVAMLNPIFFQGSVSLLDYSRIGMIIAHEITHGFDSQGFFYNPDGIIQPWWTNETSYNFGSRKQCFVEQYSQYTIPEINSTFNGNSSLNENLADNGGLRTSFRALQKLLNGTNDSYVVSSKQFSAEQLFFIGYGTMWCNSESIDYLTALQKSCTTTNTCHARSQMRVNGVISNMAEFSEAFNCPAGSPMNPENKCRLW